MQFSLKVTQPHIQQHTCLIIGIYENAELTPTAKLIDKISQGYLSQIIKQNAFQAKLGQTLPIFHLTHTPFQSLLLVGCGPKDKMTLPQFRKAVSAGMKGVSTAIEKTTIYLSELNVKNQSLEWKIKQITEAVIEGLYRFDLFKSQKDPASHLKEIIIHVPDDHDKKACEIALQQGKAIGNAVSFTKNLANLPSNICTPTFLAEQAKELTKSHPGLSLKILNENEMKKLGMGAILAVSQGSAEEAKLIVMEYKGAVKSKLPIALVGKGITFDTGGNSLKSPENMVGMKYDMCGAATVLGVMKAAAELKLPLNLVGIIPAVENMPGGSAYKPEDILTSLSGQTIEVISTDAEGRLILADALTYTERFKPEVVIDIATLTGAAVIALGHHASGLLSNQNELAKALIISGEESNDRAWQLPLWEEYQEQLKSPFADMTNSGGRPAGTITAACFLSRFAKKFTWAHLDVAGTAAMMMNGSERMATGRPVPLLTQYLLNKVVQK